MQEFENSKSNQLRSISVYFSKGVMGKRKYRSVCKTLSMKISKKRGKKFERQKIMSCKVAKLLPYEKLMACVKSIDIGWIGNVKEDFCYDLNEYGPENVARLNYRVIKLLIRLSSIQFSL